jgi:hypothetical protein
MNHMGINVTKYLLLRGTYRIVGNICTTDRPYNSCPNIILPRHILWQMILADDSLRRPLGLIK